MKTLDNGQDKIQKICERLRHETLEPAERKAIEIVQEAELKAAELIRLAQEKAAELIKTANLECSRENELFQSSLKQSAEQGIEHLRQEIESKLFNPALQSMVLDVSSQSQTVASIINALVHAIEKEGLVSDLIAHIPQHISPQEVNAELLANVLKKLKEGSVSIGNFKGGAEVKLVGKKMTLDMRDDTLKELIATFLRKDFRKYIFGQV